MKKVFVLFFVTFMFISVRIDRTFAAGELQFPSISQLDYEGFGYDYSFLNGSPTQEDLLVRDEERLKVVKASTGKTLLSLTPDLEQIYKFAANDSNTYFAVTGRDSDYNLYISIFNDYGEEVFSNYKINYQDQTFTDFYQAAFLPNTNILILTSDGSTKLLGFDIEKQQVVFYRTITNGSVMAVSSDYIVLSGDSTINIYDTKGEYVDTIQPEMDVSTMKFTADGGKLIVGGENVQLSIYYVQHNFEKIKLASGSFKTDGSFDSIDIDASGNYLVALTDGHSLWSSYFKIYDFTTGQRIMTNLDTNQVSEAAISANGKYIAVDDKVYDGKNLLKRITKVSIPTKYQKLQLGSKTSLSLLTALANGTTTEVKTGITWLANHYDIAYFSSGKLVAQKIGSLDIKARYAGFETSAKVQVVDTIRPVLKGMTNVTVSLYQPFNPMSGVTAIDLGDGNLTKKITMTGRVNVNKEGKYTLVYSVTDRAKNTAKVKRIITVKKALASNFYTYLDNGNQLYVHRNVYNKKGKPLYSHTFAPYLYTTPGSKQKHLMVEASFPDKPTSTAYLKEIILTAGKKQYKQKVNEDKLYIDGKGETYYFAPNKTLISFLTKNVTLKQTVKIKYQGYNGTITFTLNTKQKAAIIDSLKFAR